MNFHGQDGEAVLELSARFLDGRAAAGDPLRLILRLYVFDGSPDALREKWPLSRREALSLGSALYQTRGGTPLSWREEKAKVLLPPNADFAVVHLGVYDPAAHGASAEFGEQFVDNVRLTLTTQPVLPVRLSQR